MLLSCFRSSRVRRTGTRAPSSQTRAKSSLRTSAHSSQTRSSSTCRLMKIVIPLSERDSSSMENTTTFIASTLLLSTDAAEVLMTEKVLLCAVLSPDQDLDQTLSTGTYSSPTCCPFSQPRQSPKWSSSQRPTLAHPSEMSVYIVLISIFVCCLFP